MSTFISFLLALGGFASVLPGLAGEAGNLPCRSRSPYLVSGGLAGFGLLALGLGHVAHAAVASYLTPARTARGAAAGSFVGRARGAQGRRRALTAVDLQLLRRVTIYFVSVDPK